MMAETKAIQQENRQLKKMFAELSMQNELLKEALGKNSKAICYPTGECLHSPKGRPPTDGRESSGAEKGECCTCLQDLWVERDVLSLRAQAQ